MKKVFDTNMAVDIGQRVSRGLFLGQFWDKIDLECENL